MLALVGRDGAGPHDIATMLRRSGALSWRAAESQCYAEPERLERLGYLASEKRPGKTRARTHDTLNDQGLAALREHLGAPAPYTRVQCEPAMRLLAGDLLGDEAIVGSLRGLLDELDRLEDELDRLTAAGRELPHRARYLELSHGLPRRMLDAHRAWAAEVIAALEDPAAETR